MRELISSSMLPRVQAESHSMVSKCKYKRCDTWQNYFVCKNEPNWTVTGKIYKVRGYFSCDLPDQQQAM